MFQHLIQTPTSLHGDKPEFVIITEQEVRTFHITRQFMAFQAQYLLAWVI
jgi:hypothetical protein